MCWSWRVLIVNCVRSSLMGLWMSVPCPSPWHLSVCDAQLNRCLCLNSMSIHQFVAHESVTVWVECCCLTVTSPSCKLCLNISRWQSRPDSCTGTVTVTVNRSVSVLGCVCTVHVSVPVGETSTSRFPRHLSTCSSSLTLPAHPSSPPPPPPLLLPPPPLPCSSCCCSLDISWFGLGSVYLTVFVFASPCCAAALSYVGMSGHILATVAACVAVTCVWLLDHWHQCSVS